MPEHLNKYLAEQAITRMTDTLSGPLLKKVRLLLAVLDESGKASVGQIQEKLFPMSEIDSANVQFNAIVREFNAATKKANGNLEIRIEGGKRLGVKRTVFFAGESLPPRPSRTDELDSITSPIEKQMGVWSDNTPVVILLTCNEFERQTLFEAFGEEPTATPSEEKKLPYDDFGVIKGWRVLHHYSHEQGLGIAKRVRAAIKDWSPYVVIAVGIAAGLRSRELDDGGDQKLGDVLVSTMAFPADDNKKRNGRIIPVGGDLPVDESLVEGFRYLKHYNAGHFPIIHDGRYLTGSVLLDDPNERKKIIEALPPAVGYEKEAWFIADACRETGTPWCVVKGISDWGNGNKGKDKNNCQIRAAQNAALVVYTLFSSGRFPKLPEPRNCRKSAPSHSQKSQPCAEHMASFKSADHGNHDGE